MLSPTMFTISLESGSFFSFTRRKYPDESVLKIGGIPPAIQQQQLIL